MEIAVYESWDEWCYQEYVFEESSSPTFKTIYCDECSKFHEFILAEHTVVEPTDVWQVIKKRIENNEIEELMT